MEKYSQLCVIVKSCWNETAFFKSPRLSFFRDLDFFFNHTRIQDIDDAGAQNKEGDQWFTRYHSTRLLSTIQAC